METMYMLNDMIEEVEAEKTECIKELKALERSETFFKKFGKEKAVLEAKIETLRKFEKRLKMEIRRNKNFREIEA